MVNKYKYCNIPDTERLTTRKLEMIDVKEWSSFLQDKDCTEFFPKVGDMTDEVRAKMWIEKQLLRYEENKYGLMALIEKSTGEFIGQCGLLIQEVDNVPELEVGYHICKKHWGKGYATEAAQMFKQYATENKLADTIISIIHKNNLKSQNVAQKNGMKKDKETIWNSLPVIIFRAKI